MAIMAANTPTGSSNSNGGGNASNVPAADELLLVVATVFDEAFNQTGGIQRDNHHFDDFGWWALALLRGAHALGRGGATAPATAAKWRERAQDYVATATSIFELYVGTAWDSGTCGGGVDWGPKVLGEFGYKNAITNELFLALAGALHEVTGEPRYLAWAQRAWDWLYHSGMRDQKTGLFNDGLNYLNCRNNGKTTWTYNQGVVLGGLASLHRATGGRNTTLLAQADTIARAAMAHLVTAEGILREPCEKAAAAAVAAVETEEEEAQAAASPASVSVAAAGEEEEGRGGALDFGLNATSGGCDTDEKIFKGVFMRHLWYLSTVAAPADAAAYSAFIAANARAITTHACVKQSVLPPPSAASASASSSADRVSAGDGSIVLLCGEHWSGPYAKPLTSAAAVQAAALDVLVGAAWPARAIAGMGRKGDHNRSALVPPVPPPPGGADGGCVLAPLTGSSSSSGNSSSGNSRHNATNSSPSHSNSKAGAGAGAGVGADVSAGAGTISDADAVGAWARPGWRCRGDSGELVPRGRSLAACQSACVTAGPGKCAYFTFTKEHTDYMKRKSVCNYFTDATGGNGSSTFGGCAMDMSGCDAKTAGGCLYTSGSRKCVGQY